MCNINGDAQLKSASVLKAFIMAAFYDRVLTPTSEEKRIVIEEYTEEELNSFVSKMITISDNEAANTLVTLLGEGDVRKGMDEVNAYLEENGFTGTSMGRLFLEQNPSGDNYTTSNDCMRLMESIYQGTCVSEFASAQMYDYLKQQTLTGKIPSALAGEEAIIANKTGELAGDYGDYVENDIAIVASEDESYVLCILSNDLLDNNSAVSR
ncbi:MAG: class A beta-lactamase-related serine hydrolase, partial [Lachnospiraceae bacterium]|nr:class A beta-lactamase-related serine hydrolase [Lachnospiraceae bacterium]